MKNAIRWAACAAGLLTLSQAAFALQGGAGSVAAELSPVAAERPKAALAQSFGSRGTVNAGAPMYGGFEISQAGTVVYILVRGNSLQTLGVTGNFLDAPRVRLFNAAGADLIVDNAGRAGFNYCMASNTQFNAQVVSYYQNVRGQPVQDRDACIALQINAAGAYTFTVNPSVQGVNATDTTSTRTGEVLFEITLNP